MKHYGRMSTGTSDIRRKIQALGTKDAKENLWQLAQWCISIHFFGSRYVTIHLVEFVSRFDTDTEFSKCIQIRSDTNSIQSRFARGQEPLTEYLNKGLLSATANDVFVMPNALEQEITIKSVVRFSIIARTSNYQVFFAKVTLFAKQCPILQIILSFHLIYQPHQ